MKLYATLETSRGKVVSVSDNEQITATVYDGNLKAYSVIIEFTNIGDPEHWQCKHCQHEFDNDGCEVCPQCGQSDLKTIPAVMGAIVTTREWRNQPDDRRKKVNKCKDCLNVIEIGQVCQLYCKNCIPKHK